MIGGKYRLVTELGTGAMGTVWSATHQTLGHHVAIKFLLRSITASIDARARFDREARLAARLGEASRHIARVIDHGVTDDHVPYLVMELLRGESLSSRLKRERRVSLRFAAHVVQQLARALHVAHSAGVIHRDLAPANIFLCTPEDGDDAYVKLLDFGIAKAESDGDTTAQGMVLGTPSYMSPEQIITDRTIDHRTDLWAVAAVVYRMVVGKAPFGTGSLQEIGLRVMSVEPTLPSQIWPELPHELDLWIQRGLSKNQEARFQTARELSDFLAAVAGTSGTNTPAGTTVAALQEQILLGGGDEFAPLPAEPSVSEAPTWRPPGKSSRRRWLIPLAVLLASLASMAMVLVSVRGAAPSQANAAQPPSSSAPAIWPAPPPSPAPSPTAPAAAEPASPSATPSVAPKASSPRDASSASSALPPPVLKTKSAKDNSGWSNKQEL